MDGEIYFNNNSSDKFGLIRLDDGKSETPNKKKILIDIPFLNSSYDFSNIYGELSYEDRTIVYEFALDASHPEITSYDEIENRLNTLKISIENWLMSTNTRTKLVDSYLSGYYYMAECEKIEFDNRYKGAFLTVTFKAYPFKISNNYEGDNLWDEFNFELDILQDRTFQVNGNSSINIYNSGINHVVPIVISDSTFELIHNGKTYIFSPGTTTNNQFKLNTKNNIIRINGTGTIEFKFRKEVL